MSPTATGRDVDPIRQHGHAKHARLDEAHAMALEFSRTRLTSPKLKERKIKAYDL